MRADAGEFVSRPSSHGRFGVIQIDLYDTLARGPTLDDAAFYGDCRRALAEPGMLVVNLFGEPDSYLRSLRNLRRLFRDRVLALPAVPAGNVVVLAFAGPPLRVRWPALRDRARALERERLPAQRWLAELEARQSRFADFTI